MENENGSTLIDLPGTFPPETDCSGAGTVPAERTPTLTSLPAWTEAPGLDNPAFEESVLADGVCCSPFLFVSESDVSFLLLPAVFPARVFLPFS